MLMFGIQDVKSIVTAEAVAVASVAGLAHAIVTVSAGGVARALVRVTAKEPAGLARAHVSVSAPARVTANVRADPDPKIEVSEGAIGEIGIARINRMNGVRLGLKTSPKTMKITTGKMAMATMETIMLKSRLSRRKITSPSATVQTLGIEIIKSQ